VLASAVITAAGAPGKLLAGLADGSRAAAVALAEGLTGRADGRGGLVIDGACGPVLGGSRADALILPVQTDAGEGWAVADAAAVDVTELGSLDLTRPVARVSASSVVVPGQRLLAGLDRTRSRALPRRCSAPRRAASPTGRCARRPPTPRLVGSLAGQSASSRRLSTAAPAC